MSMLQEFLKVKNRENVALGSMFPPQNMGPDDSDMMHHWIASLSDQDKLELAKELKQNLIEITNDDSKYDSALHFSLTYWLGDLPEYEMCDIWNSYLKDIHNRYPASVYINALGGIQRCFNFNKTIHLEIFDMIESKIENNSLSFEYKGINYRIISIVCQSYPELIIPLFMKGLAYDFKRNKIEYLYILVYGYFSIIDNNLGNLAKLLRPLSKDELIFIKGISKDEGAVRNIGKDKIASFLKYLKVS